MKIFLHTPDAGKLEMVRRICVEQKIGMSELSMSDLNRTVAGICGLPGKAGDHKAAPALYMLPEILIFFGADDRSLDLFLERCQELKMEKIGRKAVVTPTNLGWTLYELAEELEKENRIYGE